MSRSRPISTTSTSAGSKRAALWRGVNVGGRNMVPMAALRTCLEGLGCTDVKTLLQSGNVILRAAGAAAALERRLEAETKKGFGLETECHVRSRTELQALVDGNPFPLAAAHDPARFIVVFYRRPLGAAALPAVQAAIRGSEQAAVVGRHLYLVYPAGMGQSTLTNAVLDKAVGQRGTARNWNTVNKLLAALA